MNMSKINNSKQTVKANTSDQKRGHMGENKSQVKNGNTTVKKFQLKKPAPIITKSVNPKGIVDDVIKVADLGLSALDTVVSTIENPIDGIINKLPNTIAKFADNMGGSKPLIPGDVKPTPVINGVIETQKDQNMIDALKKEIPVVQTQAIPSAFASDYAAPPITTKEVTWQGIPCTRVSGSVLVQAVDSIDTSVALNRIQSRLLNPTIFGGQITNIAQQFQRHQFLNVGLFYVPLAASTSTGSVILTFQNSANTSYTPTNSLNLLSQRDQFTMGHVFKGLSLPLKGLLKQQYNNPMVGESSRWMTDWTFEVWTYQAVSNATIHYGYVGLTYDVLLFSRIEDPTVTMKPARAGDTLLAFTGLPKPVIRSAIEKILANSETEECFALSKVVKHSLTEYSVYSENRVIEALKKILNIESPNEKQYRFIEGIAMLLAFHGILLRILSYYIYDDEVNVLLYLLSEIRNVWDKEDAEELLVQKEII